MADEFEDAFMAMSGAKTVEYEPKWKGNSSYTAKKLSVNNDISQEFIIRIGRGYQPVAGSFDNCETRYDSLNVITRIPPELVRAKVATSISLPCYCSTPGHLDNVIRDIRDSQVVANKFLEEKKHSLGLLQTDAIGLGITKLKGDYEKYTLLLNNETKGHEGTKHHENWSTFSIIDNMNGSCGFQAIAVRMHYLDYLNRALNAQIAVFTDYLKSQSKSRI